MKKGERKTNEQKERILQGIEKMGVVDGCRHFGISSGTYYNWLNQFKSGGFKKLAGATTIEKTNLIRELEEKNRLLEQLVIEKELQIKMQQEVIKKNLPQWQKKGK